MVFDLDNGEIKILLSLSSLLAFKQIKDKLQKQSKYSEALRQTKKTTFQSEILELGSHNNLTQHDMCAIIFSLKSLHPIVGMASFAIHQWGGGGGRVCPGVIVGGTDRRIVDRQSTG